MYISKLKKCLYCTYTIKYTNIWVGKIFFKERGSTFLILFLNLNFLFKIAIISIIAIKNIL